MTDSLAITGIFLLGASAGSLVSYLYYRGAAGEYRKSIEGTFADLSRSGPTKAESKMKALIVCRNPETIGIFSHLFREVGVETQTCDSESQVIDRLTSNKFEALVMDFDELSGCPDTVSSVRSVRPNQDIALFAIASQGRAKSTASSLGNSFVIERPLVLSEIRSLLRTVYGRMLRSSQAYFRMNVEIPVSLARASGPVLQCTTLNISQNGMAVVTPVSLDSGELLRLMFAIPHADAVVSANGTVIWDNGQGKAGIRFECSSASAQARFFEWLHDHFCIRLGGQSLSTEDQRKPAHAC